MIVQELQKIQERCGWLPPEELSGLSSRLAVPLHRLHEVASYYPLYRLKPPPKVDIKVCRDMACHMAGAQKLRAEVGAIAAEYPAGEVVVDGVSCLGRCDGAVAAAVNDHHYFTGQTAESIRKACTPCARISAWRWAGAYLERSKIFDWRAASSWMCVGQSTKP